MNRSKKKSFDWYGVRQRFSIRKYHIGAASVLLGTTLVLSAGTIVSAETGVNGDGASNGQIVNNDGTSDGTTSTMQPQGDNQGVNSSGVQTGNTTNSTANDQSANDTSSASGQPVGISRSVDTGTQGDGSTSQPVAEPIMIIPSSASEPAPSGYVTVTFNKTPWDNGLKLGNQSGNSVRIFVKNNVTWGTLLKDSSWQWPTVITNAGDTVVGWAVNIGYGKPYNSGNAFSLENYKDTVVKNTNLSPNVVFEVEPVGGKGTKEDYLTQYGPDEQEKWIFIKFDAGQGQLSGSKTSKMVAVSKNLYSIDFSNAKFKEKVESPTLAGHTFVRWQTRDGVVLPKSGPITTDTTYEALYLAHPQNQVAVFDSKKLTDSEKEQVKKNILDANPDLSTGVPQVIKAIDISDTGEATVTFNDDTVVKVPSATLTNEDKDTARSNAKAEIEKEATEKSDDIEASNLTEEEKIARLTEVRDANDRANNAIDKAATTEDLTKAISDGTAAIKAVSTTNTIKTKAKQALEEAYNAEKAEIENSALTAEEKAIKQADLTTAKENAIKAVDDAKTDSAVEGALKNGKAAIESTYTAIIKNPSSVSDTAPQGYVTITFNKSQWAKGLTLGSQSGDSVRIFAKNDVTWETLLNDPAWQWPTVKTDEGDTVVGWAVNSGEYKANVAFSREKYKDSLVSDINLYPNVVYEVEDVRGDGTKASYLAQYGADEQDKWVFITFDAGQGQLIKSKKTSKMVAVSNNLYSIDFNNKKFTEKIETATLAGNTFVRWQTTAGTALPKSGSITTEETYNALYLAHPTDKTAVFDTNKLTETEKDSLKQAISNANPDSANLIQSITVSDAGEATVTYNDGTVVTVPATELISEDKDAVRNLAKADIDKVATEKVAEINASNLTAEEKAEKIQKVEEAKTAARTAIDAATTNDELAKAVTDGKVAIAGIDATTSAKKEVAKKDLEETYNAKKAEIDNSALTAEEKVVKQAELDKVKEDAINAIDAATTDADVDTALNKGKADIEAIETLISEKKTDARQQLDEAYAAKEAEITNSSLTGEEKAAKLAELDKAKAAAENAIDTATNNAGVDKALEDGKSAIDSIDTTSSTAKADAKKDLEEAYNAKKAEIENSALTAEEKAAKQAGLDKAKADADKAIDAATDKAGVDTALADGKATIGAIDTTASAKKADAKKDLEEAYNAKKAAITNSGLTAEEKATKQAELDKAKEDADKAIDAATDASGVAKALEAGKTAIAAIDTSVSPKKAAAKQDLEAAYNAKKAAITNSGLTAEEKAAKQAELDKAKEDATKSIDAATDASGVAKALEAGKTAIAAIDTSVSPKKAAAKQDLEAAYNAKKAAITNSGLTAEEKAAKQAELDKAKADADKAIDAATDNAGVAKALEAGKSAIDAINTTTSAEKVAAKEALEEAYNAKKAEIENPALTAEEKAAKQAELDKAKADADKAIDAATDDAGVAKALEAGKSAIDAINTTTSAEKVAAKQALEEAYNAKKAEIANSGLTAEEKAAKQAELDKAKEDADKAIDAATDDAGVAKALEAGKSAIDAINTTTSAEKVAAKEALEEAYNAKKAEIENPALTAEEKAAKQAELDKAKEDADKAIDAATDNAGVAKALEAGKTAIAAIDTSVSPKKAAAKQDLEEAYNAKKDAITNSGLTAEEKAAKQAELDKAKEDATKSIDAATDDSGVDTALNEGKADIEAIGTIISDKKIAARQQLEEAYSAKETEITSSSLTGEEKATKLAELDKAKEAAENAIDTAADNAGVDTALEAGKTAIAAIDTTASAEKAAAKQDLEDAYNAKKAEIENSVLTADEKAAKQAELDKAKADADKAIAAATDASGVAKTLEAGKSAIAAINTTTSAEKAAAKKKSVLPNTGDNIGLSSILGVSGLALLGIAIRKKREN
ncbi:DUF1542 domain-containing protein [Streptococcus suis]|uniref:DUF1542 domain-containing protein n=1 Tax=Streptococcus suis TaxID=1307 RepID=UPI0015C56DC1|nr:DUF1542 domain-containing protein [Streptococcus suis]